MSELNNEIGERIKGLRASHNITAEEFAQKLDITLQQLSEYENGVAEIPVSFLHDVAQHYDVSLTELLTGESAKLSIYSIVRKGKGVGVSRRRDYDYQSLAYNFANRTIDPFYITITPHQQETTTSKVTHSGQEFHYLLDGTVRVKIDKYENILHAGDSIYFDSSYPHSIEALNEQPAHMIIIISEGEGN